ncbi:MAG: hypothetical protein E7644_05000 [Ruminococcaceae bacterium]|nr:hypothetical protein [Oscillospiraceae bacterium]
MRELSLNGKWKLDYLSDQPYRGEAEPAPTDEDAVCAPVPGYWEDMVALFRTTPMHARLRWNPLYTLQRYPQAGYVPDMALPNPVGCFVYQRSFDLRDITDGKALLRIGGAQNTVSAWINGRFLGRHEGYSAPFAFELPKDTLQRGENRITLAVSNNRLAGYLGRPVSGLTSRAANECTGGIYGDVSLCFCPDQLLDVWVSTASDCRSFTVHTVGAVDSEKTVQICDGERKICTVLIPKGQSACELVAEGYEFWAPSTPKLYVAEVSTPKQKMTVRFGIRRLTVAGTQLRLNGAPYFFRGVCEHCYQPDTVHPTRDKVYYRRVIKTLKELGFNSIRFHTWVPPEEYMEVADGLGMLMEIESPNNTTAAEWREILQYCRRHAAVCLYSTGNELQIDDEYEQHLQTVATLVHTETDALFSPMSAMRGIEYRLTEEDPRVEEPFLHNPDRLRRVEAYCDVYNSYSNSLTSYASASGTQMELDRRNAVYGKPLLSHEICIHGTYIDLGLMDRYEGTRIGETAFMTSVKAHLREVGLLDRVHLYYRNSAAWQQILRKHCFETVRRCESFAGYDFLGDIDTHWHTFGYCVGMMNEFYELKPGESVENVLRYNGESVLLADLPACVNYKAGENAEIPVLISHYGKPLSDALVQVRVSGEGKTFYRGEWHTGEIPSGAVSELCRATFTVPSCQKPLRLKLTATLSGGDTDLENCWELYVFPEIAAPTEQKAVVLQDCDASTLTKVLSEGKRVVLLGSGPFATSEASYQIAIAGRTGGHLATVIADHPLLEDLPHDGYCDRQFEHMLNGSHAVLLDLRDRPHRPIIDIASSYKNPHREAMLFEYRVGNGRLLVCALHLEESDPAARWLRAQILSYAASDRFTPAESLTVAQLAALCHTASIEADGNANEAANQNDITM